MPNNYVLIERIELNNTAASVTFDNIPQSGYTDLKLVVSARGDASSSSVDLRLRFNSNTTSTYSHRRIQGNGATAVSAQELNGTSVYCGEISAATGTSSTFSNTEIYVPNYLSTTAKSFSVDAAQENNTTTAYASLFASIWNPSTQAPINAVNFILGTGNFVAGSTFSLYGLAQVGTTPAIAPKADGGNVIGTDGTYWYHAFLSNGTFTPQVGLSADVLVVAGGGGAGCDIGSGSGAGGVLGFTSQSLASNTGLAVTVGGGGAGSTVAGGKGAQGTNSQFASLTASVGGGFGASYTAPSVGGNGGSGGGGGYVGGASQAGGTATSGQGNAGGTYLTSNNGSAGGGGYGSAGANSGGTGASGAGGAGGASTSTVTGLGSISAWLTATSLGVSGTIAGGGGGGTGNSGVGGAGGGGGAGAGANGRGSAPGTNGTSATINTGSGAGGGSSYGGFGGTGGSGLIIIRYPVA
jgi:hypothetical protein